jgi:DNA-binding MurR/RpiR family transcriptional regulator
MNRDIISIIEQNRSSYSKGQLRIAQFIIENSEKAAFMTASKLGQKAGVSESTVVRFAAELGYEGYPELRSALQEMIRNRLTSLQRIEVSKSIMGNKDTLSAILNADMEKIMLTLNTVDRKQFDRAVETILTAKSIYILGIRTSSALSRFMSYYLSLLFDNVKPLYENSTSEVFEQILRIQKEDVLIGISFPRYSKRTVTTVRYAKDRGASVIAITDSENSPIAKLADSRLIAKSDMVSFVDSLVAPLSLINALIVAVGNQCQEKLSDTFGELERVWEAYDVYDKSED